MLVAIDWPIPVTPTLLGVGGNLVGSEGAVQLVGALHQNKTLRKLNLRSNSILDAGEPQSTLHEPSA